MPFGMNVSINSRHRYGEVNLYRDEWKAEVDICKARDVANPNGYEECAKTCLGFNIQTPAGAAVSKRCEFTKVNTTYHTCKCPYRAIIKEGNFTENFPAFLSSGLRGSAGSRAQGPFTTHVDDYMPCAPMTSTFLTDREYLHHSRWCP